MRPRWWISFQLASVASAHNRSPRKARSSPKQSQRQQLNRQRFLTLPCELPRNIASSLLHQDMVGLHRSSGAASDRDEKHRLPAENLGALTRIGSKRNKERKKQERSTNGGRSRRRRRRRGGSATRRGRRGSRRRRAGRRSPPLRTAPSTRDSSSPSLRR